MNERTAYPSIARASQVKELIDLYTPTLAGVAFVSITAHSPNQKFALMILSKVFQKLGYFPTPQQIPGAIVSRTLASPSQKKRDKVRRSAARNLLDCLQTYQDAVLAFLSILTTTRRNGMCA